MTVLGAVVFGGLLALGVLWLLATAPDSDVDVDQAWGEPSPAVQHQLVPALSSRSAH